MTHHRAPPESSRQTHAGQASPPLATRGVPPWGSYLGPAARTAAALMLIPIGVGAVALLLAGTEHNPDNPALVVLFLLASWAALTALIVWLSARHDSEDSP